MTRADVVALSMLFPLLVALAMLSVWLAEHALG